MKLARTILETAHLTVGSERAYAREHAISLEIPEGTAVVTPEGYQLVSGAAEKATSRPEVFYKSLVEAVLSEPSSRIVHRLVRQD